MLEELSCENRVVGLKQTRRLLAAGHAGRVFLAKDADPALVEPLLAACRAVGVPAVTEFTMSQLGRAAGIAVGTAAAAVPTALKRFFRNKISYSVENKGSHPNKSLERSSLHAYF